MVSDTRRNCARLVFACLSTSWLFSDVADAIAVQASGTDSTYFAEVTGSAQMMRSEGPQQPAAREQNLVGAHKSASAHHDKSAHDSHSSSPAKVKIELYYESRCPDCVLFINNSLAPFWQNKELNPHIELKMNPYGNAETMPMSEISAGYKYWHPEKNSSTGWDYVHICQHGGEECFGNTIQACAISKLHQNASMDLILCMESMPEYGLEKSSFECMDKFNIDKDLIRTCASGPEGNKLLAEFGNATNKVPGRAGTPWLLINGHHLEDPENLLKEVCAKVGPGPTSCKQFEHHGDAHHGAHHGAQNGEEHGDDWFPVLTKINNVDKNLVILPPPTKV